MKPLATAILDCLESEGALTSETAVKAHRVVDIVSEIADPATAPAPTDGIPTEPKVTVYGRDATSLMLHSLINTGLVVECENGIHVGTASQRS